MRLVNYLKSSKTEIGLSWSAIQKARLMSESVQNLIDLQSAPTIRSLSERSAIELVINTESGHLMLDPIGSHTGTSGEPDVSESETGAPRVNASPALTWEWGFVYV